MTLQEIMDVLLPLAENHTEPLHMNVTGTEYTRHNQIRFNLSLYAREPHIPDGTHKLHIIGGTINGDQNESSTWLYPGEIVTISAHAPAPGEEFVMWNPHDNDNEFGNQIASNTTFTMPDHNVTVTAAFRPIPDLLILDFHDMDTPNE